MTWASRSTGLFTVNELRNELRALYGDASKHSAYQSIPEFVSARLGYTETIDEGWRGDKPRLAHLLSLRTPARGERWGDFGANTGFFVLSLANQYDATNFVAIEANGHHAQFVQRVASSFQLTNVEVDNRAIGLHQLHELPALDFMLHLNVLHHAGHDFDRQMVPTSAEFGAYAKRYLEILRTRTGAMLFQLGSNWGGDKHQPLIGVREDAAKLKLFCSWLRAAGWNIQTISYPRHALDGHVCYGSLPVSICDAFNRGEDLPEGLLQAAIDSFDLDSFPGEFYRRPLFLCRSE